jgi:hypothetical protein
LPANLKHCVHDDTPNVVAPRGRSY